MLAELLRSAGYETDGPQVIPDGAPVERALREAASAGYDVVVTTGGTGLTPGDLTPEMTRMVVDREIPGIAEAIRAAGVQKGIPAAMLSRGLAGLAGATLIVNLPGSTGGVKDGMSVVRAVLDHALDQAAGGDHPRPAWLTRRRPGPARVRPGPARVRPGPRSPARSWRPDGAHARGSAMMVSWHMRADGRRR